MRANSKVAALGKVVVDTGGATSKHPALEQDDHTKSLSYVNGRLNELIWHPTEDRRPTSALA